MCCPIITGHTGNDQTTDNSLDSVYKSIELGADAFELDVRRDQSAHLVLSHNPLCQEEYNSCRQLSEVFEILKHHPGISINCDLKEHGLSQDVIKLASDYGMRSDRLILTGLVTIPYLKKHPRILKQADIYLNGENILEEVFFELISEREKEFSRDDYYRNPWKNLRGILSSLDPYISLLTDTCLEYGVKGINMPFSVLTDENVKDFRSRGVPVSVWTVNEEKEIHRFLTLGVKNLTTRNVAMAKSLRNRLYGF